MCDRVKEESDYYIEVRQVFKDSGCIKQHDELENCLNTNNRDWRACQQFVLALGNCVRESKQEELKPKST